MEYKEDIKKIIGSITGEKGKVLILDEKENLGKWKGFKCVSQNDLQSIKDNFDVVIVNNLEDINSEELMRIGNKFIILNSSFDEDLIEKSDKILDKMANEGLNDEIKFIDEILGEKREKLLEKKKLSYVILEKEDLISRPSFLLNLALIQSLKRQIAEREKIVISQRKELEIFNNRIKQLENDLLRHKKIIDEKEQTFLKLENEKKELIKKYDSQINDLNSQINDLQLFRENEKKELIFNFSKQLEEKEN